MLLAAVLDDIVQEAGDGLVFVAAVLEHQARDRQQVIQVGDPGPFPHLPGMGDSGIVDRIREPLAQGDHRASLVGFESCGAAI